MPNNQSINFKYNSDGIRTYKYFIDNDEMCLYQHDYMLEGSTIVGEKSHITPIMREYGLSTSIITTMRAN